MKDFFIRIKSQLTELWQKTTNKQKIIVISSGVLIILALSFFAKGATSPDYVQLFGGMDETSATNAIEKIKAQKIPYQLTDGGKTIKVPSKNVDELRIQLVSDGTASDGNVSFSIFDKQSFGETDTDRRVKFLRALQGELTRTIEKFPQVEKARVQLVTPEPSLFEEKQKDATAAVWLNLKPGQKMQDSQVNGLIKLVSSSVEGLKPEKVTVVDTFGNVLSKYNPDTNVADNAKLSETQLQLQQKTQEVYQSNIQSMLDKVVGVGQSVVRVQVDLDLDKVHQDTLTHNGNKATVSEQTNEKSSKNTTTPGGTPGVDPNTTTGTTSYQGTDQTTGSSDESSKIKNYEVDKFQEARDKNPGQIKRMSVSVVYNESDQQKQKSVEEFVKNAAGIDTKRGDTISVVAMPFNTKYADDVRAAMAKDQFQQQLLTYGGIGLAALALGLIGFVVYRRRRAEEGVVSEEEVFPMDIQAIHASIDEEIKEEEMSPEEKERKMRKQQVEKVATQNPADVAALLKTWLAEE